MRAFDVIWEYVSHCYEEQAYIPSEEEVEEAIGHDLTLDGLEQIDEVVERFIGVSVMDGVKNKYKEAI